MLVGSLLSLGLVGVPLLLLGTGSSFTSGVPGVAGGGRTAATHSARPQFSVIPTLKLAFELPSSTTSPPTTAPTTTPTTAASARPAPTTTTTTSPPPPTLTTTVRTNSATGIATWYSEAPAGTCASPWLPKGVTLTVTELATGATVTCVVQDREGDNPGRVVDLSPSGFETLAPLSQGTIQVSVSW